MQDAGSREAEETSTSRGPPGEQTLRNFQLLTRSKLFNVFPKLFTFAFIAASTPEPKPGPFRPFPSLNAKSPGTPSMDRLRAKSILISVSPLTENPPDASSAGRAAYAIARWLARVSDP